MTRSPARSRKLIYLVTEDWYFVSHRLPLAVAAREAGYNVAVVTRVDRHGDVIRDAGLKLLPLDFSRSSVGIAAEARTISRLTSLYRREGPDLVHHVAMKPVIYGSIAARRAGITGIVNAMMGLGYVFSSDETKARLLRPIVRRGLGAALKGRNTRVVVQNEDDFALFQREGLARQKDLRLIRGSGVDPFAFEARDPPPGLPLVVLPARILVDKGIVEFVDAARMLKAKGVLARFALVGDPDDLNPASIPRATIAGWVEKGVVEHWGWRQAGEMGSILSDASLVCLPSYREGLPKALLEAAASGRAIVTTDVPGCREIVRPGVNGWRVPARDATALAAALGEAIARPDLCRAYGAAGRRMVEQEFSLERVIGQMLAVYEELAV